MNFVDFFLAIILLYGLVKGVWKGLFIEFASLISLLIGIYLAIKFSGLTANLIRDNFDTSTDYIEIIAFAITFIAVVIGIVLLAKVFTKIANFANLGWINRLLGGIFGLIKMIFILSVFLHFFHKINTSNTFISEEKLTESILYKPIVKTSEFVFPIISEWFDKAKQEVHPPEAI